MKICLIVEDSEVIAEIAARILRDLGLEVREARSVAAAISAYEQGGLDAIMLDWDMPSLGALDFLRAHGQLSEDQRRPIILMATENDPQQFALARAAGAEFHILKPFDRDGIAEVFARAGLVDGSAMSVSADALAPKAAS